ncbi:MAG: hypothetical protein M1817_005563 [Caeruleum heppii]|nr:MAG: hypothetical protein M1817_005563 [Caeruleum heppii]
MAPPSSTQRSQRPDDTSLNHSRDDGEGLAERGDTDRREGLLGEGEGGEEEEEEVTELEGEVLREYERLNGNLRHLSSTLSTLADSPTAPILDDLRALERKTSLVFTALKASVYSIVLQQQIYVGDQEGEEGRGADEDYEERR